MRSTNTLSSGFTPEAVNDNGAERRVGGPGTTHPWPSTIHPRDEEAPGAKEVTLEIRSPISPDDYRRAIAVFDGGRSIRLWSASGREADWWAWQLALACLSGAPR